MPENVIFVLKIDHSNWKNHHTWFKDMYKIRQPVKNKKGMTFSIILKIALYPKFDRLH
jgi:hypothetical protein